MTKKVLLVEYGVPANMIKKVLFIIILKHSDLNMTKKVFLMNIKIR